MTNVDSVPVCPSCESPVRTAANFCEYCGRPLAPRQTFDQYEADNLEGRDSVDASDAPLNAEPAPALEVPEENRAGSSVGTIYEEKPVTGEGRLRELVGRRIWSLVLWSGSPILFLVILVAAVARDNYETDQGQALLPLQGGNAIAVSEWAPVFADAPGLALPLDIISPFTGVEKSAVFETVSAAFKSPRGVTAANGNLYVVDPDQSALIVLDADGQQLAQILHTNRRFIEPVDVAADDAGNVYVLDAGDGGQVSIHGSEGEFLQVVPVPNKMADRSRGIDVDSEGRIWLALTPALAVVAFDIYGQELIRISTDFEGADLQPVDVAFHSDSSVYVSTAGMTAVLRFSLAGELLNLWPLVTANSVDGPHLSLDSEGNLYATQPEQGGILRISGDNAEEMEAWVLPGGQSLRKLVGITVDGGGNLLVTDSESGNIYRVLVSP